MQYCKINCFYFNFGLEKFQQDISNAERVTYHVHQGFGHAYLGNSHIGLGLKPFSGNGRVAQKMLLTLKVAKCDL